MKNGIEFSSQVSRDLSYVLQMVVKKSSREGLVHIFLSAIFLQGGGSIVVWGGNQMNARSTLVVAPRGATTNCSQIHNRDSGTACCAIRPFC